MAVGLLEGFSCSGHSPYTNHFFAELPSEGMQKGSMQPLEDWSTAFSFLLPPSCLSFHSFFSPDEWQCSFYLLPRLSVFSVLWKCGLEWWIGEMLSLLLISPLKALITPYPDSKL